MGGMRLALASLAAAAACSSGIIGGPGGGGSGSNGGGAVDAASDAHGPVWIDASSSGSGSGSSSDCRPPVTAYGDGHHNTGRNCMDSCHNHGFTLAGTLYTTATNNTGFPGATITVQDANNQTIDVVVQANGNFYTSQAIAYPALVRASSCPYSTHMTATIANGACNSQACHQQSGGAQGQIHLP